MAFYFKPIFMLPIVAIVGKPNVGKSTLFNRLIGKRLAIESKFPGTTRDRIFHEAEWEKMRIMFVDTGGLEFEKKEENIEKEVQEQAKTAIREANLIIFVVDIRDELTRDDLETAGILRKSKVPVILVANKAEKKDLDLELANFCQLGLGDALPVSGLEGFFVDKVQSLIVKKLLKAGFKKSKKEIIDEKFINVAFLGRPNVGKSSLVNAILKENRLIVSDVAGTTRDSVDIKIKHQEKDYNLIDTAGLKRRGHVRKILEKFSLVRSLAAIERCDVGVLILDYSEGVTTQDCHVAQYILEKHKGLIIAINKSDLINDEEKDRDDLIWQMQHKMDFLSWAPLVFVSAKTGKHVYKLLDIAEEIKNERKKKIATSDLNNFLYAVKIKHPPGMGRKGLKEPKLYYVTQTGSEPPVFTFFVNERDSIHFSYRRFLENELRKKYGFTGTAIKLEFRNRRD